MAEPYSHPDSTPEPLPDTNDDSWCDLGSMSAYYSDVSTSENDFNTYHGSSSTLRIDGASTLSNVNPVSELRPVSKSPFQDVTHGGEFVPSEVEHDIFNLGGEYDHLEDLDFSALPNTSEAYWPTPLTDPVTIQISGPTPSCTKFDLQLPNEQMGPHVYEAGLRAPRLSGSLSLYSLSQGQKSIGATSGLQRSLSDAAIHSDNRYVWSSTPWSTQVETPESLRQRFNSEPPSILTNSSQDHNQHVDSSSTYQLYQPHLIDARPASADPVPRVLQTRAPTESGKKRKHGIETLSIDQSYITNPPIVPSISTNNRPFNHVESNTHGEAYNAWPTTDHRPSNYLSHLKPVNFSHYSTPDTNNFQLTTDSSLAKRSRTTITSNSDLHFPDAPLPIPIDPRLPQARAYHSAVPRSVQSHSTLLGRVITPHHQQKSWTTDRVQGPMYGSEDTGINMLAQNVNVPAPINYVGPLTRDERVYSGYFWPGSWSTSNTTAASGIYSNVDAASLGSHVRLDTHAGSDHWSFEGGPSNTENEYEIIESVPMPRISRDDLEQDQTDQQIQYLVTTENSDGVKEKGAPKRDPRKKRIPEDCCLPQEGEYVCLWGTCGDTLKFSEAETHYVKKHKLGYKSDKSRKAITCLWHDCSKECAKSGQHTPCNKTCAKSGITRHVLEAHIRLVYVCGAILKTPVNGEKPERCTYSNARKYITTSHYVNTVGHPLLPVNLTHT